MGLEAKTLLHTEGLCFEIKALLESNELIIRGPFKFRATFNELKNIHTKDECLCFDYDGDSFRLELGDRAEKWRDKVLAPPKSLFEKLGIKQNDKACAFSELSSVALSRAIIQNVCEYESANLMIAEIKSKEELDATINANSKHLPIWVANIKGKESPFGENQIREIMRNHGYKDNKTCSIDEVWSATRYYIDSNK